MSFVQSGSYTETVRTEMKLADGQVGLPTVPLIYAFRAKNVRKLLIQPAY
jgi:hypothetical protein